MAEPATAVKTVQTAPAGTFATAAALELPATLLTEEAAPAAPLVAVLRTLPAPLVALEAAPPTALVTVSAAPAAPLVAVETAPPTALVASETMLGTAEVTSPKALVAPVAISARGRMGLVQVRRNMSLTDDFVGFVLTTSDTGDVAQHAADTIDCRAGERGQNVSQGE